MAVQIKSSLFAPSSVAPEDQIHFIASTNFSNVNFFRNTTGANPSYDFSNLEVYINGELTEQAANAISANADDDVIIKATSGKYPWFIASDASDLIKSVEEPFPLMHQANGKPITSLSFCFDACSSLTSIPLGLFDNNTQVTDFSYCFSYCDNLTSIPLGLFDNNTQVTDFSYCFYYCRNLTVNVQIGSTASSVDVDFFAHGIKEKGTVYCRAVSAAYNAFVELSDDANVNVLTY